MQAQARCVTLSRFLNLSGPLAPALAMPAASSHPSDLGSYVTCSERPSLTLNDQFGCGGLYALRFLLRLGPPGAGILPFLVT